MTSGPVRRAVARARRELAVYRKALSHPGTPRAARWLLGLAVAYAVMPFELIPDFIPVIGFLDDLIVVAGLAALALRMIPPDVLAECRAQVAEEAVQPEDREGDL